jgi:hypothetical protein
LFNAQKLIL